MKSMGQGDRDAFAELFRLHQATVFRFARQMSGSRDVAEDITQDVFVALLRQADRFDPRRASLTT
jgi:RNA polymerase sigma-70 factor (ECF subfamily)